ncbi:MAG TPA: ABC transporter permease subunit [Bacteroidetes bacterium]|nr:ABC transporter permease subunit [Bacteroidota bacterium]
MFELRGHLTNTQSILLGTMGAILLLLVWWALAELKSEQVPDVKISSELPSTLGPDSLTNALLRDSILRADSIHVANATSFKKVYPTIPLPLEVMKSYGRLMRNDDLAGNAVKSVWLTLQGYFWAVVICLPIGFVVGLLPLLRGLFSKPIEAMRFLPITALIGVFIIWFGIYDEMKIAFLAFGIIVFLLPAVIQRIDEVEEVFLQTVFTLGATDWQTVKTVYIPAVMSKLIDDIRVLTAVSWTYIIITEYINKDGGLGALIYIKRRLLQMPDMFAIILLIILIGFLQDRVFVYLGRRLFPFRFYKTLLPGNTEVRYGIWMLLAIFAVGALSKWLLPGINIGTPTLIAAIAAVVFIGYGEYKIQAALRQQRVEN